MHPHTTRSTLDDLYELDDGVILGEALAAAFPRDHAAAVRRLARPDAVWLCVGG